MKKIAIIGAGLSGLTLAEHLADIADVTLFEKHHHVSGRMAVRNYAPFVFDHGAQFFTVKHPEFSDLISRLQEAGVVARWDARFVEVDGTEVKKSRAWENTFAHYVGVPDMSSVGQFLYQQLLQRSMEIHLNTHVSGMQRQGNQWCLIDAHHRELGRCDWVITAMPAKQAASLMPNSFTYQPTMNGIQMLPCYALMLGFEQPLNLAWDAAHITNSILSWASVNSSKPGRSAHSSLVVMSRNQWAAEHVDQSDDWVKDVLMQALAGIVGDQVQSAKIAHLKKWHFANAQKRTLNEVLIDAHQQLASCGDWCISGRVESAFVAAKQLGRALQTHL